MDNKIDEDLLGNEKIEEAIAVAPMRAMVPVVRARITEANASGSTK